MIYTASSATVLTSVVGQLFGIMLVAVALIYFVRLYSITHQFSYVRMFYFLFVASVPFGIMSFFVVAETTNINSWANYPWLGIVVSALMGGCVCLIAGLGLGCGKNGGMLSKTAGEILQISEKSREGGQPRS